VITHKSLTALWDRDWNRLKSLMTKDVVWSFPGKNSVFGDKAGEVPVVVRTERIVNHRLTFTLKNILVGQHGVATSLREAAWLRDMVFDEHLTTAFSLRNGRICTINTYGSEGNRINTFFNALQPRLPRQENPETRLIS
jgi:ketosteroid isomerase-like protein